MTKRAVVEQPQSNHDKLLAVLHKNAKKGDAFRLCKAKDVANKWNWIDFIDPYTGFPCLQMEYLFGSRGLLNGRILRLEAEEGVGKSSLSYLFYGMGQRTRDAFCIHQESEAAPPPADRLAVLGVDTDRLLINRPRSVEECLGHVLGSIKLIRTELDPEKAKPIMQCIDSIRGLAGEIDNEDDAIERDITKGSKGKHARMVSDWFREGAIDMIEQNDAFIMFTAQLKSSINIGGMPGQGPPEKTSLADRPIAFHSTYIFRLSKGRFVEIGDTGESEDVGDKLFITCTKNKVSPMAKSIMLLHRRRSGFDFTGGLANFMADKKILGMVTKGGYYSCPAICDKNMRAGEVAEKLYSNTDLLMSLREQLFVRGFGFDFEKKYSLEEMLVKNPSPITAPREDETTLDEQLETFKHE